ncbi:MAG: DUF5031 domain-containing protein [Parabacteroides sp.]|nr:DUF5031 domain-containing protein [Parabacteroides sp.]
MKRIYNTRIAGCIACISGLAALFACSDEHEASSAPEAAGTLPVSVRTVAGNSAAPGLTTKMYIFETAAGTKDYRLKDSLVLAGTDGQYQFAPEEMRTSDYQFLFLTTPAETPEIALSGRNGAGLTGETHWNDTLFIVRSQAELSPYNYYSVEDIPGARLLDTKAVETTLQRLVGQMVFAFFRTAEGGGVEQPASIVSDQVSSVIDRVYEITVTYANPEQALRLDADGQTHPAGITAKSLVQTIAPQQDEAYKTGLPQPDNHLLAYGDGVRGAVRIEGPCFFPSEENMQVALLFRYYDTTPVTNPDGTLRYEKKELPLRLTDYAQTEALKIIPDYITLSKGGIRCDRIIDVPVTASLQLVLDWDTNNHLK